MMKTALIALALLLVPATAHAEAAAKKETLPTVTEWQVKPEESSIQFSGKHAGTDFTGSFKKWTAKIAFDPKNLEGSSVEVAIDTASATTGNKTYDGSLPSPEWLDAAGFPTATFTSETFRQTGDTTFEVDGTLKLKGIAQKITLPFTLTIEENDATMEALLTLDRIGYDIGKKPDASGEWVTKDIAVTITVKATKAP